MDLGISGKVALVAAASKGIGKAVALGLAQEGCSVSICGRTLESLESVRDEIVRATGANVHICQVDVSSSDDISRWVSEATAALGAPSILVTNTGGPPAAKFMDLTDEQWEQGVQSTLMNIVRLVRLTSPAMAEQRWGRIVHITSLVAKQPFDTLTISSTLRAGISALTRNLSNQLAPSGILVNAVLPGHTLTDRAYHLARKRSEATGMTEEQALAETAASIPVGRYGQPNEIADAVVYLCSQRASFITGECLLVDGGSVQAIA